MLERGAMYRSLKKSYVIFICTFDLFGEGRHIYTFENRCVQDTSLALNDGTYRIFLNAKGTADDVSPECKAFLEYVAGKPSNDEFVQALEERVREVKMNKEWRRDYMTMHMRDLVNREDGREEGREEGLAMAILRVLKKNGSITQTADLLDLSTQEVSDVARKYGFAP